MKRDGTRVEEELGPVERARLLQNVVKLWIVKRLYEFVLFAQASRFFLLSFFFHSPLHSSSSVILSLSFSPLPPPTILFSLSCSPSSEFFSIATTIFSDSRSIILLNTKRATILFRESRFVFCYCSIEEEKRRVLRGNMDRIHHLLSHE